MSKLNFVKKLLQFQFRKLGRISHKFTDNFRMYHAKRFTPTIFVQNGWNFHQMTTTCRGKKLRSIFWKFWILAVLYSFESNNGPKNEKNWENLAFFGSFLVALNDASEDDLLKPTVSSLRQKEGELVTHFIARLHIQANLCNLLLGTIIPVKVTSATPI